MTLKQTLIARFPKACEKYAFTKARTLEAPRKMLISIKEKRNYQYSLKMKKPYFGAIHNSLQGAWERHHFMYNLLRIEKLSFYSNEKFKILEIGSWAGGSAITWAQGIKDFFNNQGTVLCMDPWKPYTEAFKASPFMYNALNSGEIFELFLHNINSSGLGNLIRIFKMPSSEGLDLLAPASFDLIFVDGAHDYQSVKTDLKKSAQLLKPNGILCGDDLELQTNQVPAAFLNKNLDNVFMELNQTSQWFHPGVTKAVGEFFNETVSSWLGFWAMRNTETGWKKLNYSQELFGPLKPPAHFEPYLSQHR